MFGRRTGRWAGAIAGLISDRTRSRKGEKIERIGLEPVSAPWCSVLGGKSDEDASPSVKSSLRRLLKCRLNRARGGCVNNAVSCFR